MGPADEHECETLHEAFGGISVLNEFWDKPGNNSKPQFPKLLKKTPTQHQLASLITGSTVSIAEGVLAVAVVAVVVVVVVLVVVVVVVVKVV